MKATFDRVKLLTAVSNASRFCGSAHSSPLHQHIHLACHDLNATLTATDTTAYAAINVEPDSCESNGAVLLRARIVRDILRNMSDEVVSISTRDGKLLIETASSEFICATPDVRLFPAFPEPPDGPQILTTCNSLREIFRRTLYAADRSHYRTAYTGIALEYSRRILRGIAVDGRRLAMQTSLFAEPTGEIADGTTVIVPYNTAKRLAQFIEDTDARVHLTFGDTSLLLATDTWRVCTQLVEGRFIDWRRAYPEDTAVVLATVPTCTFISAVRSCAAITDCMAVRCLLAFGHGSLHVETVKNDVAMASVRLPIEHDGQRVDVLLDLQLLLDYLSTVADSDEITIAVHSPEQPVMFSTYGNVALIMPLQPQS